MAAFSERVNAECVKLKKKVNPDTIKNVVVPQALSILTAKTFSAEADRTKAFSDYFAGWAKTPDNPLLADTIADGKATTGTHTLSPTGQKVLGSIREQSPRVYAAHNQAAAAS